MIRPAKNTTLCKCQHLDPDRAAETLLAYVASLDPTWAERLAIALEERHWTAKQCFGAYVGYMLENSLHLSRPEHTAFLDGTSPTPRHTRCALPSCHRPFDTEFPGQRYCTSACATAHETMATPTPLPPAEEIAPFEPLPEPDADQLSD